MSMSKNAQTSQRMRKGTFASDILNGLAATPKRLSSKYFYDSEGDRLFQEIMHMPEYYLTNSELEIFQTQKKKLLAQLPPDGFELVELGAGDGLKTKVLLEYFVERDVPFTYIPIDISQNALDLLQGDLTANLPQVDVNPIRGEYFHVLADLRSISSRPKVILFLGANIGNLPPADAIRFLSALHDELQVGDLLFIGFDLKKDPAVILNAYNDPAGITAAFNLNLLKRINRELGANFIVDQFRHWETYNPMNGETRSYLISEKEQFVYINALAKEFHFTEWEAIEVELSQKYDMPTIQSLSIETGFESVDAFFDSRKYFVDVLWRKA